MQPIILSVLVAALSLDIVHAAPTPSDNTELIGNLITTPTQIKRYRKLLTDSSGTKLLSNEELAKVTVRDFTKDAFNVTGSQGGVNSAADPETFPFLINADLSVNIGTVGPCGILLPHVHPRANEFFVSTSNTFLFGTRLEIGLLSDLVPSPEFIGTLTERSGTLFPQGSLHWQINDSENCQESSFVVFLTSGDPGTTTILQEPAGNGTVGRRTVGKGDFELVRAVTPPHIVELIDKCFERCNIA